LTTRCGGGVHPAVARLGEGAETLSRIVADRPALVAVALLDGVPPTEVAAVLGWDLTDLRLAVERWASRLWSARQLTDSQRAALLEIVLGPGR
jgi:hypothetical protein